MQFRWLSLGLVLTVLLSQIFSGVPQVNAEAFNARLSPGKKVLQMNRGESITFDISYLNQIEGAENQMAVSVNDFYFDQAGVKQFIDDDELAREILARAKSICTISNTLNAEIDLVLDYGSSEN